MATRARELEKLIAPIKDKLKAFIKARLDSVVNADKIATAHSALMEAIGAERQNHSNGATKEYFENVEAFAKKYAATGEQEKKFATSIPKAARDPLQKAVHWIANYIDREDEKNLRKYRDESFKQFEAKKAEFEKLDPEFATYVATSLIAMLDDLLAQAVLHGEASKVADPAAVNLKTVEDALARGQADKANKFWEELKTKADAITSNAAWLIFPEVKDFCMRYEELAAKFGGAVEDVVANKEIDEIGRSVKTLVNQLDKALSTKSIPNATKYANDLKEKIAPLIAKHASQAKAQALISDANKVLERYQTDIEPMMLESDAKTAVDKLKVPLRQLENSLSKKDDADAMKHRDTLEAGLGELKAKFSKVDVSKQFIEQADAVLKRMETELGAIIAEKTVKNVTDKLKPLLSSAERYLGDKNALQVQVYVPKIEEQLVQLKRYEANPEAKKWLDQSKQLLQRVDKELGSIIAAEEIERYSTVLQAPLSSLEGAIQRKDIAGVAKFQERVASLAAPLRKYANEAKAVSILTRVNSLLKTIERDISPLSAADSAKKISAQIAPLVQKADQAGDVNAATLVLQKLLFVVHPVKIQYGHFDVVKQALAPVDGLMSKINPQLNQFQQQEAQRLRTQIEKDLQQIDANRTNPGVVMTVLKDLNKTVAPLKKTMLIDSTMNGLISRVDQLNLEIVGKVPTEEEFIPTFDVTTKTPSAWQKPLKSINEFCTDINSELLSIKQKFESVDRKVGAGQFNRGEMPNPWAQFQKAMTNVRLSLDKLEGKQLSDLSKADANCPHIQELKDNVATVRQLMQEWDKNYGLIGQYIQKSSMAFLFLKTAMTLLNHVQALTPGDRETAWEVARGVLPFDVVRSVRADYIIPPHEGYWTVQKILNATEDISKQAQKIIPDDCAEAVECMNTVASLKKVVGEGEVVQCQEFVDYWIKNHTNSDWMQNINAWINVLKQMYPAAKEIVEMDKKVAAKLKDIKEEEERRMAELEAKKQEEANKRNAAALQLQAEADSFTGGSVSAAGMVWKYTPGQLTCESGLLKGWSGAYKAVLEEGVISLRLNEGNENMPVLVWRWNGSLLWGQFRSIQVDTSMQSWIVYESKDIVVNADVSGSVPVQIAVIVSNIARCVPVMQTKLKEDIEKQRLVVWKQNHFEKLRVDWNNSCKGCSTSGGNWKFCYDCEKTYCTSVKCGSSQPINICIYCKSYNGGSIPTSPPYLKTPQNQSLWINTQIPLPVWTNTLLALK